MTAEGNVADTSIVEEANQLIAEKEASDMPEALEILKQQAKRDEEQPTLGKDAPDLERVLRSIALRFPFTGNQPEKILALAQ